MDIDEKEDGEEEEEEEEEEDEIMMLSDDPAVTPSLPFFQKPDGNYQFGLAETAMKIVLAKLIFWASINGDYHDLFIVYLPLLFFFTPFGGSKLKLVGIFEKFKGWHPYLYFESSTSLPQLDEKFQGKLASSRFHQRFALAQRILELETNHTEAKLFIAEIEKAKDDMVLTNAGGVVFTDAGYKVQLPVVPQNALDELMAASKKGGGFVYQEIVAAYTFSLKDSLAKGVYLMCPYFSQELLGTTENWSTSRFIGDSGWGGKWAKHVKSQVPKVRNIVFATHANRKSTNHFTAMRIDLKKRQVHVYDSDFNRKKHFDAMRVASFCTKVFRGRTDFKPIVEKVMQQATYSNDCSVYACCYLKALCKDPDNWASGLPNDWETLDDERDLEIIRDFGENLRLQVGTAVSKLYPELEWPYGN